MQSVNGVDQGHPAAPELPQPIENSGEPLELSEDLKKKLKEPLPTEAVSPNPLKPGLSAIKVIYVVERLNEVFGLNGWHMDNEVVETGHMVVVRATLAIPKYGIAIEQFGGNDNPDRGDAYKGACTDALSKCASYLGIGMDVYKGLNDNRPRDSGGSRQNVRATIASPALDGRINRTWARNAAPTGLTNRNMAARFSSIRGVLGAQAYQEILGRHGYREVTNIPSLDKAREVYRTLLDAFRLRFREAQRKIGNAEYTKILGELRLNPKARLNPDQAVRVFNHMEETLNAGQ
jgi:Rad52/22 family double-strand break repair protein